MENRFLVGASNDGVSLMNPPAVGQRISVDDALNLAAYLVAIADPAGDKFAAVLGEVLSK